MIHEVALGPHLLLLDGPIGLADPNPESGRNVLVAADIIRTVAVSPTLESVAVLAGIVLVRTGLSFSLEVADRLVALATRTDRQHRAS